MTKIEAIKKYWRAVDKLNANTFYDGNGRVTVQSGGLKGAETKAARRAIALCKDDKEFIFLCNQVREEDKN